MFIFFFFSSRRRHTRCLSDWSSDVCSSDLCSRFAVYGHGDCLTQHQLCELWFTLHAFDDGEGGISRVCHGVPPAFLCCLYSCYSNLGRLISACGRRMVPPRKNMMIVEPSWAR